MSLDYHPEDLSSIPDGADLGLGCGVPTAFADLKEGDTVLDLGSGAGIDVFIAARHVGFAGKAIGVDMTEAMVERAKMNAQKINATNVEFRLGEIDALPVENDSVDRVISNCVINLVPNKANAFREIYRVLKAAANSLFPISSLTAQFLQKKERMPRYGQDVSAEPSTGRYTSTLSKKQASKMLKSSLKRTTITNSTMRG